MNTDYLHQIQSEIGDLDAAGQQQVLAFVRSLKSPPNASSFARLAGSIPGEDLAAMRAAIESGCEQVDLNEW